MLIQTRDKFPVAATYLTFLSKKLRLIMSRLLGCLEFDLEEFDQLLEAAEGQARRDQGFRAHLFQYIIIKLGLDRDPLAALEQDLSMLECESQGPRHSFTPLACILTALICPAWNLAPQATGRIMTASSSPSVPGIW